MSADLEILLDDEELRIARAGPVLLYEWRQAASDRSMQLIREVMRPIAPALGDYALLQTIPADSPPPDDEARKLLVGMMSSKRTTMQGLITYAEGPPVRFAHVKSVMLTFAIHAAKHVRVETTGSLNDALALAAEVTGTPLAALSAAYRRWRP